MTETGTFASEEAAQFWRYIAGSLDRLMALVAEQPASVLQFRPPAVDANSILGLARHTLANARDNILGVMLGEPGGRDRQGEFEDLEPAELLELWSGLRPEMEEALMAVHADLLGEKVDHGWRGPIARREVLIVVARHAAEHLGQAELTRDLAIGTA
ncbi:MAG: DinB family protein [Dehalococcoidia bacterium]|nr:DinB family protein [Dehalococcoidia bacterium]